MAAVFISLVRQPRRKPVHTELGSPPLPNLAQTHYRFRNDDGTETTATWRQPIDTPDTVPINTLFRLRIATSETMGGDPPTHNYRVQWRQNGGAWTAVSAENAGAVVQGSETTGLPNNTNTTQQISSGTFRQGFVFTGNTGNVVAMNPVTTLEDEWALRIGHQGGATPGDLFEFRVVADNVPLDAYPVTPSVTVTALVSLPPATETRLSPSTRRQRGTSYILGSPTAVTAQTTAAPVETTIQTSLAASKHPSRPTLHILGTPTVVSPEVVAPQALFQPKVSVTLAERARLRWPPKYGFISPAIIAPPIPVDVAVRVHFAVSSKRSRRGVSFLVPPTVLSPAVVPPAPVKVPIRVTLVRARNPVRLSFKLNLPQAVTPIAVPVDTNVHVNLAQARPTRKTSHKLHHPVVVGAPVAPPAFLAIPVHVRFAIQAALEARVLSRQQYKLHAPAVVTPFVPPPPPVVTGVDDITPVLVTTW